MSITTNTTVATAQALSVKGDMNTDSLSFTPLSTRNITNNNWTIGLNTQGQLCFYQGSAKQNPGVSTPFACIQPVSGGGGNLIPGAI